MVLRPEDWPGIVLKCNEDGCPETVVIGRFCNDHDHGPEEGGLDESALRPISSMEDEELLTGVIL